MASRSVAVLVNLVGFLSALGLYAMLLGMVWRHRQTSPDSSERRDALPLVAALLGLVWNAGALAAQGVREASGLAAPPLLLAAAYTALGFLPALVVHAALDSGSSASVRPACAWIRRLGYGLSAAAGILQVFEAVGHARAPSPEALRILALGFGAMGLAVLYVSPRPGRWQRGLVWAVALLAFGISALHLARHEPGHDTLSSAVYGHHASLPLALAILYQDYRFALADLFLKRALSLLLLAGLALGLYLGVAVPALSPAAGAAPDDPRGVIVLIGLWVATALAYPGLRRGVAWLVDAVMLCRPDYASLRTQLGRELEQCDSVEDVLAAVSERLGPALSATRVGFGRADAPRDEVDSHATLAPVATADPPSYQLRIDGLTGGRRLLSDDLQFLESVALLAARRIDAVRLTHERWQRAMREQEVAKLATEAELRALRAQLNPHFFFNALTTIGYLMRTAPARALETLLQLTHLLRAVLKRSGGDFVTLAQELDLVESYLAIEKARFEERLRVQIDAPLYLRSARLPPLVVQPLVENAIKHGIAPSRSGGELRIRARTSDAPEGGEILELSVEDSGVGAAPAELARGRQRGLGLANIEKRLRAYYGSGAALEIRSQPGEGTTVELRLPVGMTDRLEPSAPDQAASGRLSSSARP